MTVKRMSSLRRKHSSYLNCHPVERPYNVMPPCQAFLARLRHLQIIINSGRFLILGLRPRRNDIVWVCQKPRRNDNLNVNVILRSNGDEESRRDVSLTLNMTVERSFAPLRMTRKKRMTGKDAQDDRKRKNNLTKNCLKTHSKYSVPIALQAKAN